MIRKKKLVERLNKVEEELREKDSKINALLWCIDHPGYAIGTCKLNMDQYQNNNCSSYFQEVPSSTTFFPYELHVTYFNKITCHIVEHCLVRTYQGPLRFKDLSYDVTSGNLTILFSIEHEANVRHFKYVTNMYDLHASRHPKVYLYNEKHVGWISLPYYSNNSGCIEPIEL